MKKQGQPLAQACQPRLKAIYVLLVSSLACWQNETQALPATKTEAGQEPPQSQGPMQVEFDRNFLRSGAQTIDISRYARGNVITVGTYNPDIHVNGNWVGRREVRFDAVPGATDARPCFSASLLQMSGVDMAGLPEQARTRLESGNGDACLPIEEAIAEARAHFDFDNLRLDLSIPQVSLRRRARGYVGPEQWNAGVPVGMLGYNLNTYHSRADNRGGTQGYLGLTGGLNLQRWHFRHNGSLSWADQGRRRYQSISSYVQRDVADWSSQLIIGDTYTGGDLLDSTSFRGLRLHSDDRMLPQSQRGYAPVVRGVAHSNARVTISQNGMKLYETTVAPGAFVIDDLYPTGYGGDLQVSVAEADGSVRSFAVPYASVPLSLREGRSRYSLTAGAVRHLPNGSPLFSQATWQYGLSNTLTGYGGGAIAKGYLSPMAGAVLNTDWGAFGFDLTHASTRIPGEKTYSGQSLRASYAKTLPESGTHLGLVAYRYSTNGFFGLNDAMLARDQARVNRPSTELFRPRNRASLTLGQRLGEQGGHLSVVGSTTRYWNREGSNTDFSIGYSNSWRRIPYSLSATRQRDAQGIASTLLYVGLSIPLGDERPSMLTTNFNRDSRDRSQAQANLSGLLGDNHEISYGLSANRSSDAASGAQANGSASVDYRGPIAEFSGSLSAGTGYQQFSAGMRGAVVAHPGGVTLSQPLGETFAIVEAKNAEGARITNASGVQVDSRGYAVVPYLTPYVLNEVSLDPKGLSTDVELQETSQQVAPLAGAVPMMVFKTTYSRSAVIQARQADGSPVPFGAVVSDGEGNDLGVVGQAGKLLVRGLSDQGELQAHWQTGEGAAGCSFAYALPERKRAAGYQPPHSLELPCVASAPGKPVPMAAAQPGTTTTPAPRPQALQLERGLAGLRLSARISALPAAQIGKSAESAESSESAGRRASLHAPTPAQSPADHPRALKIERTLAGLPPDTLASAGV